jgi:predicted DsbA family dithiol-disulfide isomerase
MTQEASVEMSSKNAADRVAIVYYTDPLCCWSWALEPQWRKLRYQFQHHITWRYCMGGLLPGWKQFSDGLNAVSRPAQMGPIWMEAAHLSGMPINTHIWIKNPPASSYLACIAVTCAQLQSASAGEQYLRLLREAVMLHGENISVQSVLLKTAEALAQTGVPFDLKQFDEDLKTNRGRDAFRNDLHEVQNRGINRFPSLVFSSPHHASLLITGYRPYEALVDVLKQMQPGIENNALPIDEAAYRQYWGSLTDRELKEATDTHEVLKKLPVT